ncbi:unnamed protein product [Agarophyton chilense]
MAATQLAALHARIQQLEADNASLASAAEQAAVLAEEYAADAARYRHSQNNTEQSLHDEISDASRRKDRRIQRLNVLLSEEKDRTQQLEQQVEDLEQLRELSNQMEITLQDSVSALQQQVEQASQSSSTVVDASFVLGTIRATHAMVPLEILNSYFPQSDTLQADFKAYYVFLRAHSIHTIATYAKDHFFDHFFNELQTSSSQQAFIQCALNLFGKLAKLTAELLAWCFEKANDIPYRAGKIYDAVITLEQRTASLFEQLFEIQQRRGNASCTPEYVTINTELLEMAMDTIFDVLPAPPALITSANCSDLSSLIKKSATERAHNVCEGLINASRDADAHNELQVKLNAARTKLQQRERELDDMKVRLNVYEDRMTKARQDAKLSETLKIQVSKLEEQIANARDRDEPGKGVQSVAEADSKLHDDQQSRKTDNESTQTQKATSLSNNSVATPLTQLQQMKDIIHIRRQLLRTHLSDISSDTRESKDHRADLQDVLKVHSTLSCALNDLRAAAANASVVTLHPDTLKVKRGGFSDENGNRRRRFGVDAKTAAQSCKSSE